MTASRVVNQSYATGDASTRKVEGLLPLPSPIDSTKNHDVAHGIRAHQMLKSSNSSAPILSGTSSGAHFSSSDPVLLPSEHVRPPIRHEMDSQCTPVEQIAVNPTEGKSASGRICAPIRISIFLFLFLFFLIFKKIKLMRLVRFDICDRSFGWQLYCAADAKRVPGSWKESAFRNSKDCIFNTRWLIW